MTQEKIKEALKKDFRKLYVKEFTANWKNTRLVREVEIDVMSLVNLEALLAKPQQPEQEVCPEPFCDNGMVCHKDNEWETCPICHGEGIKDLPYPDAIYSEKEATDRKVLTQDSCAG